MEPRYPMQPGKSRFLEEVGQQPQALRGLVAFYRTEGAPLLDEWVRLARKSRRLFFSGMGTSEYAPESILQALAAAGIDATTHDAGEQLHYPTTALDGLRVLISQSGESVETRCLTEALGNRHPTVVITNDETSSMARAGGLVLPLKAGAESAISTKTYINTLAVLYLMSCSIAGDLPGGVDRLEALAGVLADCDHDEIRKAGAMLSGARAIAFVARGPAVVAAKQAALTFMEGTRIPCSALTGGAFRHGPFELVDASHRAVFLAPGGHGFGLLKSVARETAELGGQGVFVTDQQAGPVHGNILTLKVPDFGEELFPLSAATTHELLLHQTAMQKGVEAGVFRHGSKVTARE